MEILPPYRPQPDLGSERCADHSNCRRFAVIDGLCHMHYGKRERERLRKLQRALTDKRIEALRHLDLAFPTPRRSRPGPRQLEALALIADEVRRAEDAFERQVAVVAKL